MSDNLQERLEKLQTKILDLVQRLKKIDKELDKKDLHLRQKEQELEQVRTQLLTIAVERDDIREQVGKKIDELNVSNLSKEEKAKQISNLMTGEYQKLKGACQKLTKTWTDFNKVRDSLNELEKALSNSRLKAIQSLEKTKRNLWITVFVLLFVVFLLSLSLSLSLTSISRYQQKKKKKRR